ncbi:hypothetical protein HDG40_004256 [Paraburkholderia sp. JPY158]|uniref:Uncharacterized protein n=1 Tax=Paraburkholderia atlantica TaxID=2654982 RepID=A0A7W8V7U3_PARAM|nr:hypothetical protein [Paraburkholderia atlantica]MBB5426083.1 hypothetical protein [Paraburkholderia atlantica]
MNKMAGFNNLVARTIELLLPRLRLGARVNQTVLGAGYDVDRCVHIGIRRGWVRPEAFYEDFERIGVQDRIVRQQIDVPAPPRIRGFGPVDVYEVRKRCNLGRELRKQLTVTFSAESF